MMKRFFLLAAGAACLLASAEVGLAQKGKPRPKVQRYMYELCLVSDDKLGEMGKPIGFAHQGREIKVCCKDCVSDFKAEPARYMKKLAQWDQGVKTQK